MAGTGLPALLADENIPLPSVRLLRAHGVDVLAAVETCPHASDAEILQRARAQCRWLVTFDRDFGQLVFRRRLPPPPAVLYIRQGRASATHAGDLILELLARADELAGCLVVVGGRSLRVRRLPE